MTPWVAFTKPQRLHVSRLVTKPSKEANNRITEDANREPSLEGCAKDGVSNLLINILDRFQLAKEPREVTTIAETQMVKKESGATPLIAQKDGNIASLCLSEQQSKRHQHIAKQFRELMV